MILISHRGNLHGKTKLENQPEYVENVLKKKFNVEVDVWFYKKSFYLGHDKPQYKIKKEFLSNSKIWCHAKNPDAMYELSKTKFHYFWHQNDNYTITSRGFIWVYPKKKYFKNSVIVIKNRIKKIPTDCYGICSDYVGDFL